jgi:hypothetical protein
VFTHESGKFLGVCGGQVCGLEKRQQERPQQDITSDFTVITITEGSSTAARPAAVPTLRAKAAHQAAGSAKAAEKSAVCTEQATEAEADPFAFHPAPTATIASKRNLATSVDPASKKRSKPEVTDVSTKRGRTSSAVAPVASQDSDDDKPFKFPRAAAAKSNATADAAAKSPSKPPAVPAHPPAAASPAELLRRTRKSASAAPVTTEAPVEPALAPKLARSKEAAAVNFTTQEQKSAKSGSGAPGKKEATAGSVGLPESFAL